MQTKEKKNRVPVHDQNKNFLALQNGEPKKTRKFNFEIM